MTLRGLDHKQLFLCYRFQTFVSWKSLYSSCALLQDEHLFFRFIDDGKYSVSGCFQPNSLLNLNAIGIDLRLGLKVQDRRTNILRKIKNCFTGSEFVDFLVTNKMVHSREDSVRIGRALKSICKLFESVGSKKENISCFKDDPNCFYGFCLPNKISDRSGIFLLHDGFRIGVTWSNAVWTISSLKQKHKHIRHKK